MKKNVHAIPADTIHQVFLMLVNLPTNNHCLSLVPSVHSILKHNLSLALFAPETLLSWFWKHLDDESVFRLLQVRINVIQVHCCCDHFISSDGFVSSCLFLGLSKLCSMTDAD